MNKIKWEKAIGITLAVSLAAAGLTRYMASFFVTFTPLQTFGWALMAAVMAAICHNLARHSFWGALILAVLLLPMVENKGWQHFISFFLAVAIVMAVAEWIRAALNEGDES